MKFTEFPLHESTHRALEAMGFEDTTPIQEQTIPQLLEGRDLIAQAQTGTGKTAAFGIPLIEAARAGRRGIVLTPTRELARQVQRELQAIGKGSPVDVVCLIGGAHFGDQVRALKHHPDAILVATPGRVVDHLDRGTLDLSAMAILALDEADEMLSMGFQEEVDRIVATLPDKRQTMLFTATLPPAIERLAQRALQDPVTVRAGGKTRGPAATVDQAFATVSPHERSDAIRRIVLVEDPKATLVFCRTRSRVDALSAELQELGAEPLHGGMTQSARDAAMQRVRNGRTNMLVATDVAARGLDVEDIELVIHDEPAGDTETYIHRVGRTGRAGRTGRSILLLHPRGMRQLSHLSKVVGRLQRYDIPDDAAITALQTQRLVEELDAIEPSDHARELYEAARAAGMEPDVVALRALSMLTWQSEVEEPVADKRPANDPTGSTAALSLKVGNVDGVRPGDIVGMIANEGGLDGQQIGRIDILPRMTVVEVPAGEVDRLVQVLGRSRVRNREVRPREAKGWGFKAPPRR